jgi:hypothetical protein
MSLLFYVEDLHPRALPSNELPSSLTEPSKKAKTQSLDISTPHGSSKRFYCDSTWTLPSMHASLPSFVSSTHGCLHCLCWWQTSLFQGHDDAPFLCCLDLHWSNQLDRDIKQGKEQTSQVIANIIKINLELIVPSKCALLSPIRLPS